MKFMGQRFSKSHARLPISIWDSKLTPVICREVSPLEDALGTGEVRWELEPHLEHSVPRAGVKLGALPIALLQEVAI